MNFTAEQLKWIIEQAQFKVTELWEASMEPEDLKEGGDLGHEFRLANEMVDKYIMEGYDMPMDENGSWEGSHVLDTSYRNGRFEWKKNTGQIE